MKTTIILRGLNLRKFCQEVFIKKIPRVIIININDDKAEYYNSDTDCHYKLNMEIAKKYLDIIDKEELY